MNQLSQLLKALVLENDQGLTTDLSIPVSVTPIVNSTSASEAQIPAVMISSEVLKNIAPVPSPKMGYARGSSPCPS